MTASGPKKPPILGTALVIAIAIGALAVLIGGAWCLYHLADKKTTDFFAKLGEFALQLAVVVIAGALVKVAVDWHADQRERYLKKLEERKEFMRRIRAMHVTIQNARDLMNAHRSARTWDEQSRRLLELRPEIEEICEDLKDSDSPITQQTEIVDGLKKIIKYLDAGRREYIGSHAYSGHEVVKNLPDTIELAWVCDFMEKGNSYKEAYEENFKKCKRAMRKEVYGA